MTPGLSRAIMPNMDTMSEGKWFKVTLPVQSTKTYIGKVVRVLELADGGKVYQMQGRTSFSVVSDEVIGVEEVEAPRTGVPREPS